MSDLKKKRDRILFIMNPKSGTMQAFRYLAGMLQMYSDAGFYTSVLMTQASGDAREFAIQYASEVETIVVSGGDGTLNEVIDGVITAETPVRIGYIPSGSTNDFASSVGLPKSIMDAAEVVLTGKPQTFDVGSFNGRYFSYVASFLWGIHQHVIQRSPEPEEHHGPYGLRASGHSGYREHQENPRKNRYGSWDAK